MRALAFVPGLLVGVAYGYAAQRGAFCLSSGFRNQAMRGETTKVKALGLAVALQLLFLPAVLAVTGQDPTHPSFFPIAGIVGGLLFGASMFRAGGCAAGIWYKAGTGDLGAAVAIVGLALGATAAEAGPLAGTRVFLQSAASADPAPPSTLLGLPIWIVTVPLGALVAWRLWVSEDGVAGAWSWRRTGLCIGASALLAWPAAAAVQGTFGLSVVPGTVGGLRALTQSPSGWPSWELLLVLGIAGGGHLAARVAGTNRLSAPQPAELMGRFVGGLGLGVGSSLAAGCTMGHGVTGLPLLAPGSLLVMLSIFAGSAAAALLPGVAASGFLSRRLGRGRAA